MRIFLSLSCFVLFLGSCKSRPLRTPRGTQGYLETLVEGGTFRAERSKRSTGDSYVRFVTKSDDSVLTREQFVDLLGEKTPEAKDLRDVLTKSIVALPGTDDLTKGIMLKSPVINQGSKTEPYYYKAILGFFDATLKDTFQHSLFHCDVKFPNTDNNHEDYKNKYQKTFGMESTDFKEIEKGFSSLGEGAAYFFWGGVIKLFRKNLIWWILAHLTRTRIMS